MARSWWLSFANDDGFLGCALVGPGSTVLEAAEVARSLGIHPGGEVAGLPTPAIVEQAIPDEYRDRLLTLVESRELDELVQRRMEALGYEQTGNPQRAHVIAEGSGHVHEVEQRELGRADVFH